MPFTKKTWKDRVSEYGNRRTLTDTTTNEQQVVLVTRNEGAISQEGDAFSAANMNDLEDRIEEGIKEVTEVSISTSEWVASTYGYSCTKTLSGVESTDKVHFSVEVDMTSSSYQSYINARAYVQDVVSNTDSITIYATAIPAIDIVLDVWGY